MIVPLKISLEPGGCDAGGVAVRCEPMNVPATDTIDDCVLSIVPAND